MTARRRQGQVLALLLAALALAAALSVTLGARAVGWSEIGAALGGETQQIGAAAVAARLPRTALAMLAGAALAVSGAALQGVSRNPLADPGLLGLNAGAALAVVLALAFGGIATATGYVLTASLGAALAAALVQLIAGLGRGRSTPLRLALAGAATTAALSALTTALVLPRNDIAGLVQSWQIGGVGGASWAQIGPVLPFWAGGLLLALVSARGLNLLALGEETAAALGTRVWLAQALALAAAILLSGASTAVCGPIGFVGLVVPHLIRLLTGVDHRWQLGLSALAGAVLLTLADVAGRIVARPAELDVGILTAFLGAPVFLWILRRQRGATL